MCSFLFFSWVTPHTKITVFKTHLANVDSKLFQGPPQGEYFPNEKKVLHASFNEKCKLHLFRGRCKQIATILQLLMEMQCPSYSFFPLLIFLFLCMALILFKSHVSFVIERGFY